MAKDESKELRTRLHQDRLPADRKTELPATREPRDPSRAARAEETPTPKGRTPEEVIGEREERQTKPVKAVDEPTPPAKKWKVQGEELTLDQIAERAGMMDALVTTHEQHKYLQEKYEKMLEKVADGSLEAKRSAEVAPPPPRPTPQQILDAFAPRVKGAAQEGYIEAELPDAYPLAMSQMAYMADCIERQGQEIFHLKNWVLSEIKIREARAVAQELNNAVDAVAAMDGKIYEMLRKPEFRKKFIDWVYKEVDPNRSELNPERMHNYYLAFNGEALLELAKHASEKETPAPRPRVRSEGTGSGFVAPEPPQQPKSLLKRMTESRLGTTEE